MRALSGYSSRQKAAPRRAGRPGRDRRAGGCRRRRRRPSRRRPVTTMRVTAGSSAQASSARAMLAHHAEGRAAFSALGRLSVTRPAAPRLSQRISSRRPCGLLRRSGGSALAQPGLHASIARPGPSGITAGSSGVVLSAMLALDLRQCVRGTGRLASLCERATLDRQRRRGSDPILGVRSANRPSRRPQPVRVMSRRALPPTAPSPRSAPEADPPPAPQPQGRVVAPARARERAHRRRPDLAALPDRGRSGAQPVASMPGVERLTVDEAVREAERAAELAHPGDRAVSLHRSGAARRPRLRGAERRTTWSAAPSGRSRQAVPGDRHHHRRRARSLYQPRP